MKLAKIRPHCILNIFAKCKANDFSLVFAWQLFQIKKSHMCVNLAESRTLFENSYSFIEIF